MVFGILLFSLPVALIIALSVYLPICYIQKKKGPVIRHFANLTLIIVIFIIVFATLLLGGVTFHPQYHFWNLKPFIWVSETYEMGFQKMIQQLALNILMFVPVGFLLPVVFNRLRVWHKTLLCSLAFTIGIEVLQFFTGRSADVDDVIMNGLGAFFGFGCYYLFDKIFGKCGWWSRANHGLRQRKLNGKTSAANP